MNRRRLWITLILTVAVAWGSMAAAIAVGWGPKLGLDLQGGFSVLLVAPDGTDGDVLDKAVEIMRQRIENLGSVQEPEISVQGDRAIQVQLPGVQDRERALQAVGTTGELSFRPVLAASLISPAFTDGTLPLPPELELDEATDTDDTVTDDTSGDDAASTTTSTTTTLPPPPPPENLDPDTGLTMVDDVSEEAYLQSEDGLVYHVGPAFLTGADVAGAQAGFLGGLGAGGGVIVDPQFTAEGAVKFEAATAELSQFPVGDPRRQMAIVVDGAVVSAPSIAAEVAPGTGLNADEVYITMGAAEDAQAAADDLATILRYGALPTTFERERVESVSASLGDDSLRAGLIAGLGALLLVAAALVIYYRALGLVAVIGLTVFGSILMVALTLLSQFQGTTLTLAGVTGVIVSLGITADSYIVYFERIKEEYRKGRPLRAAVDHGFRNAFRTILTADFVTFSGSILLWVLAIGPVKGFAITLGVATVIDVLVAYLYTRPAVALMSRGRLAHGDLFSIEAAMGGAPTMRPAEAT